MVVAVVAASLQRSLSDKGRLLGLAAAADHNTLGLGCQPH